MSKSKAQELALFAQYLNSNGQLNAITMSVDGLTDVDTTTTAPTNGQSLVWDGANFVPGAGGGGSNTNEITEGSDNSVGESSFGAADGTNNLYYTDARVDARIALQVGSSLDLSGKSTSDLSEGTNLYYTDARADARIAAATSDDVSEGSTNLYFTNERVDDRVNQLLVAGTNIGLSYDDANNTYTINSDNTGGYNLANNTTDNLSEGSTNLYYTNARVDARIASNTGGSLDLSSKTTTDLAEGTNLYYTDARVDTHLNQSNPTAGYVLSWNGSDYAWIDNTGYTAFNTDFDTRLATKDTGDLSEGTNLYYTDARVQTYIGGDRTHGNITADSIILVDTTNSGVADPDPTFTLYRNSPSPSNNDQLGQINFTGRNDSSKDVIYAQFRTRANVITDSSESGNLFFRVMSQGTLEDRLALKGENPTQFQNQPVRLGNNSTAINLEFNNGGFITTVTHGATANQTITLPDATGTLALTSQLYTDSDVATYISGNRTYGNITTAGYIAGPASFTIDPAAVGDNTGTVIIAGNLQVDGTTTTINSTTLDVDDLNITVASGAANAGAANGAGLTVDGASATLTYVNPGDNWAFNKPLDMGANNITTTGKILYSNIYSAEGDLPSASTYHGMFAHVHATGKGYFAHGGNWIKLLDETSSTTTNLSEGTNLYYTDTRADARIALQVGANLDLSNKSTSDLSEGTNLYYTDARVNTHLNQGSAGSNQILSWNGSDYAWVAQTTGYGDSNVDTHLNTSTASTNEVLAWNGSDYDWVAQSGGIALTDLSVGAEATAAGDGAIAYNNSNGVFTYTPPVLSGLSGDTDDISEGSTNQYFTSARVQAENLGGSLAGTISDAKMQYATSYSGTAVQGSFFFDSLNAKVKVYNGSAFVDAVPAGGGGGGGSSTDANTTFRKYIYTTSSATNSVSGKDDEVVTAGNFVEGYQYEIISVGTTNFTAIGASANTVGVTFTATGTGSGTGTAGHILNYATNGTENVEVFVNGIKQVEGASNDYVATTGTSINFVSNFASGDVVDIQVYELLTNSAYYTKTETYTQAEVNSQITTAVGGNLTLTGLTVDTDTLKVDTSNNRVGIGTASPLSGLHISDGTNAGSPQNASRKAQLMIDAGATASADLQFMVRNGYNSHIFFGDAADPNIGMLWYNHTDNTMNFLTNTSTAMTIDSAQQVGIGTESPADKMHIYNASGTTVYKAQVNSNSIVGFGIVKTGSTNQEWAIADGITANGKLQFYDSTDSAVRMQIDGSGFVGIGPNTPTDSSGFGQALDVNGTNGAALYLRDNTDSKMGVIGQWNEELSIHAKQADGTIKFYINNGNKMTINSSGNVGIGTNDPSYAKLHVINDSSAGNDNFMLMLQNTTTAADTRSGIMFSTNSGQGAGRDGSAIQASNNGVDGKAHITFGNVLNNTYDEKIRFTTDGNVGIGTNAPTTGLDMYGAGNIPRIKLRDSSAHQLNMGLWDGSNHRIEGDANRPLLITSYHSNGVAIGGSGSTNMQVGTGGVDFLPNSTGSFNFKAAGGNQLSIKTGQYTGGSGTSIGTSNIQIVNSAFGALVFVAGYGNGQFCDLVYFGYNASPTIIAQQTIAGSPPSRIYTGSGYALYLRYGSGTLTTKVNYIQSHS